MFLLRWQLKGAVCTNATGFSFSLKFYSDQDVLLWQRLIKELSVLEHYHADGGAGLTTFNITSIEKYTNAKKKENTQINGGAV